ncbi:MAG: hypothetical protein ACK56I_28095, partial [bacterium]
MVFCLEGTRERRAAELGEAVARKVAEVNASDARVALDRSTRGDQTVRVATTGTTFTERVRGSDPGKSADL